MVFVVSFVSATPWNISTAVYDNVNISTQAQAPADLFLSSDGTKLYELGDSPNILQYSCSDAWNLSSCSYDSISISVETQAPVGLFLKSDGTKLYELGDNTLYQYNCTDAWNLSSCAYESISLVLHTQSPTDFFIGSSGNRLYELGDDENFYQHTCSDAWNISSCTDDSISLPVQTQAPADLFLSSDGTKLYELGDNQNIFSYTCTDAWNLSSCSYDEVSIATQDSSSPTGIFFKPDGTKLYEIGSGGPLIYQSSLADANPPSVTINTPLNDTYDTNSILFNATATDDGAVSSCWYSLNGGISNVSLSNSGDYWTDTNASMTQGSHTANFYCNDTSNNLNNTEEVTFIVDTTNPITNFYSPANNTFSNSLSQTFIFNFTDNINLQSSNLYIWDSSGENILAWDISKAIYDEISIPYQDGGATDLFFKPDGTKMYEAGYYDEKFYQHTCSDAWNLSSCTYDSVSISTQDYGTRGLFFKPDGLKLYEVGATDEKFYQYTCSDAWNLSSCTYDSVSLSTQDTYPYDLSFKPDGTKMYEVGSDGEKFYQYTCSDAWNLSSCTYDSVSLSTQDTYPHDLFFKPDGLKLYELAYWVEKIFQYSCSSAWDLSSCTYDSISISTQDTSPQGLFFKPDGTKMYELGSSNDLIYQYSLSPPSADISGTSNSTTWNYNFTDDGVYQFNAYTCDVAGNCAFNSTNYTITIDITNPSIEIVSPVNNTNTTDYGLSINYTYSDANVDTCWWTDIAGGINTTITCGNNVTGPWVEGSNTVTIFLNDSAGNENSDTISFIVDNVAPNLILSLPQNNSYHSSNESLELNYSSSDALLSVDTTWYYVLNSTDGYEISNTTITTNTTFNISSEGNYTLYLYSNDTVNNINSTSASFIVDLTDPNITIVSPSDGYTIQDFVSGSVPVDTNFSLTETNLDSCWYTINSGSTNTSISCSAGYNNFTFYLTSAGTFTLEIFANDSANNENSSSIQVIMNQYSGPQQGSTASPDLSDQPTGFEVYNKSLMCQTIGAFILKYPVIDTEKKQDLLNLLSLDLGFAVSDEVMNYYLENYQGVCIGDQPLSVVPDGAETDNTWIISIVGIVILIILLVILLS